MRLRRSLSRVFHVVELGFGQWGFCGVLQDVIVKVLLVVDLIDELVHTGRCLNTAALEWLGSDDLAVVHNELLVEGS